MPFCFWGMGSGAVELEGEVDVGAAGFGVAVAEGGGIEEAAGGFDGAFVEAHAEGADDDDVLGLSGGVDGEAEDDGALIVGAARGGGEGGVLTAEKARRGEAGGSAALDVPGGAAVGRMQVALEPGLPGLGRDGGEPGVDAAGEDAGESLVDVAWVLAIESDEDGDPIGGWRGGVLLATAEVGDL